MRSIRTPPAEHGDAHHGSRQPWVHPEWPNPWGRLEILLPTRDASGGSRHEVVLAQATDAIVPWPAGRFGLTCRPALRGGASGGCAPSRRPRP